MTTTDTIAGLRRRLDSEPENAGLRGIYADALEESGEPKLTAMAEGYRALWKLGKQPSVECGLCTWFGYDKYESVFSPRPHYIGQSWFRLLNGGQCLYGVGLPAEEIDRDFWRDYTTLAEAEDAAAEAFGRLPEDEKRRILEGIE